MSNVKRWDEYFYNVCKAVEANSVCLSRKIGAVLERDKSIISTGYNGPARNIPHCNERYLIDPEIRALIKSKGKDPDHPKYHNTCPRYVAGFKSGEGLDICIAGHGERNALNNAARHGIKTKGAKLFMTCGIPCKDCLTEIINCGIEEIIITKKTFYDSSSKFLLDNSDLKVRIFEHLKDEKSNGEY